MNHAERIEWMQNEVTQTRNRLTEDRHALERARKEHADLNSQARTLRARYSVEGNEQDQIDADKLIKQSDAKAKEMAVLLLPSLVRRWRIRCALGVRRSSLQ